ncbi:MAG: hypothetical protein A2V88_04415 [Elusimicrobia bacterium RBG_16_66_12]|nr:MAG: hypothetical protein A2V88_04415 [Elusimicrobia bacterium RBG_16_66_12]
MDALETYLETGDVAAWGSFDLGIDLEPTGDRARDVATAGAYTLKAVSLVWQALPEEVRGAALDALTDAIAKIVTELIAAIAEEAAETAAEAIEAIPIIGWVIKIVRALVVAFVDIAEAVDEAREDTTARNRAEQRREMFRGPASRLILNWIEIRGFPAWQQAETPRWRWAAAMTPDRGEGSYWFGIGGLKSYGKWKVSNGVGLHCPSHQEARISGYWAGCKLIGNENDRFSARMWTNALAWPYFAPNYPSRPMQVYISPETNKAIDPNLELIEAQLLALMDARTNFTINLEALINITTHFLTRWRSLIQAGVFVGHIADPMGSKQVEDHRRIWTPDLQRDHANVGSSSDRRFYFDDRGLVTTYPGFEAEQLDLATFGLMHEGEQGIACSLADLNSVVASTRAVISARQRHLRDGRTCAGIVKDRDHLSYAPELRAAVEASASAWQHRGAAGGIAPPAKPSISGGAGFAPPSPHPSPRGARPGATRPGSGPALLLAAGAPASSPSWLDRALPIVAGVAAAGAIVAGVVAFVRGRRG